MDTNPPPSSNSPEPQQAVDWADINKNWWHRKYWKIDWKGKAEEFLMEIAVVLVLGVAFGIWLY